MLVYVGKKRIGHSPFGSMTEGRWRDRLLISGRTVTREAVDVLDCGKQIHV